MVLEMECVLEMKMKLRLWQLSRGIVLYMLSAVVFLAWNKVQCMMMMVVMSNYDSNYTKNNYNNDDNK